MAAAQLWLQNIEQFISSYTNLVSSPPGESDSLKVAKIWCKSMGNLMLWGISKTYVSLFEKNKTASRWEEFENYIYWIQSLKFDKNSFGCKGFWSCWKQEI